MSKCSKRYAVIFTAYSNCRNAVTFTAYSKCRNAVIFTAFRIFEYAVIDKRKKCCGTILNNLNLLIQILITNSFPVFNFNIFKSW